MSSRSSEASRKTALARKARDPDAFKKMGMKGGKAVKPQNRPFFKDRDLAKRAGITGGSKSRRK